MFITSNDYVKKVRDKALQQMIDDNPDILIELEKDAQSYIETHLRPKYDTINIFNKTGADRHRDVVMCMLDIILYWLTMRIAPKQAQETRVKLYEDVTKWLSDVAKGKIAPDLPILEPSKNMPSGFRLTSKQPPQDFTF